jgi:hypothetical protein
MKSPYPALFAFLIGFSIPALAEPPTEQGAPGSNAATPENAIPLTPEMIRELGRRFHVRSACDQRAIRVGSARPPAEMPDAGRAAGSEVIAEGRRGACCEGWPPSGQEGGAARRIAPRGEAGWTSVR